MVHGDLLKLFEAIHPSCEGNWVVFDCVKCIYSLFACTMQWKCEKEYAGAGKWAKI